MTVSNFSFPSKFRLNQPAEFKEVFLNPIKSTDRYFTFLAIKTPIGYPRIGLAIAKKIVKKAVRRNVIKRTIRESFRLHRKVMGSLDIVVLVRKDAIEAPSSELRESLERHWLKLVARCKQS